MEQMPRPMPPLLYRERNRHGTVVFYVRKGKGPRIRVRGAYGTSEFAANYQSALLESAPQSSPVTATGTLAWLITCYKGSSAWDRLSVATKVQRDNFFSHAIARAGDVPLAAVTRKVVQQAVEDRAKTPFAANNFLKAMRGLFRWAKHTQHVEIDPTEGVKGFPQKTEGFHAWTDEEIARFEERWAVGTRERLAIAVLLYTGFRRGDAAILGRQHLKDGVITFRTAKTGQQVTIPLLPELARIIDATKTGDLAFIATAAGRPMTKGSFGEWFGNACKAAGVPGSAHGLRKAGATRAANNGATTAQLNAIYGWTGEKMASLYTRDADRVRLARDAIRKLVKSEPLEKVTK
jgi:integrase